MESALRAVTAPDVKDTVALAAGGDDEAFRRLISAYHDDMRRVCRYVADDIEVAEEATQAAWVTAWRKLHLLRDPERVRPWLMSVAINEAKQLLRRRRPAIVAIEDVPDASPHADPATRVAELDLHAALRRLDIDERALLALRYVAGFDARELSLVTGISPAGTRQRLKRILDRLREDLADA